MVNVEEFSNRLKVLIDYYEISATILAEKMDVQRSSISHILSGRNKPSLDFVLKILKTFPEVELYWLLNGVGIFPKQDKKNVTATNLFSEPKIEHNSKMQEVIHEPESTSIKQNIKDQEIDRIVIFFKDGSFRNYHP